MNRTILPEFLEALVSKARACDDGEPATYIPELASVDLSMTSVALMLCDGSVYKAGDVEQHIFTIQSVSKLVLLIAFLEEFGEEQLLKWVNVESSGKAFASISHLDLAGAKPANPLINPGAITLCGHIPGATVADRMQWMDMWVTRVFGKTLTVNQRVFESERRTGDRNRAMAYLMRSDGLIEGNVDDVLEVYFSLCSYETKIEAAAYLPMLLANAGCRPNGEQVFSKRTAAMATSIMATCGLYDESGLYLMQTGMPAKSGVSGLIVASSPGRCGVAVSSPRINQKGGSVRGHIILHELSRALSLSFALPGEKF